VRIIGFKSTPKAGDPIICLATEQEAQELVEKRLALQSQGKGFGEAAASGFSQVILSGFESKTAAFTERKLEKYDLDLSQGGAIRIPVVLKAGADGSVSAVRDAMLSLSKQSSFDINLDVIAEGVGALTATEIAMAKESNACIFCFDIKNQDKTVVALAEAEGVRIHEYDVIYTLLDEAKEIFTAYLPPLSIETVHGKAKVQALFEINNGKDTVAGLKVLEGVLHKNFVDGDKAKAALYRVVRGGTKVTADVNGVKASTLKKFKEEVESVRHGDECGLSFSKALDFKEGDVIECFSVEMKKSFTGAS
jgi:translation initiation factor IF-2